MPINYTHPYLANLNTREVHQIATQTAGCQLQKIIEAGHATGYWRLETALGDGYDPCAHCLSGSTR